MSYDPNATRPHSPMPPPAMRGTTGQLMGRQPHSDFLHHPLHRVYRRKIRGVRLLWFMVGMLFGGVLSLGLILLLSALAYTRIPKVEHNFTGEPDLTITVSEEYISSQAQAQMGEGFRTINPNLTLTGVRIEVGPENRIDYQANFHVNIPFFSTDVTAAIKNQINSQDGKLVVNMVGDPQIGNLNLPLESLPFNLKGEVTRAVDSVNNGIVVAQINRLIESNLSSTDFFLDGVTTDEDSISLRLRQK